VKIYCPKSQPSSLQSLKRIKLYSFTPDSKEIINPISAILFHRCTWPNLLNTVQQKIIFWNNYQYIPFMLQSNKSKLGLLGAAVEKF